MGSPVSISVIGVLVLIGLCQCVEYGIIVDFGSTGTKLSIFKHGPEIQPVWSSKHKPGLQDIEEKKEKLTYLKKILSEKTGKVPESFRNSPVYVFITSDKISQDKNDMDLIRDWFPSTTEKDNIKVLTEEQEGALLWVAANYVKKSIEGVINMGSSSTQLIFKSDDPNAKGLCDVKIDVDSYKLFVKSYSQFGVDGIYDGITKEVQNEKIPVNTTRTNPCILKGDTTKNMPGGGDADDCMYYSELFVDDVLTETPMIPENTKFMATGAFVYPGEDIYMFDSNYEDDRTVGLGLYVYTADSYCQNTFGEVGDWFDIPENRRSTRCYLTAFAPVLLKKLGLDDNKILVTNKLHGYNIDVALGAMILEATGSPMPCAPGASKKRELSKTKFDTRATRALLLDYIRRAMKDV